MKSIRVVAAIIKSTNETGEPVIFATQRGYGDYKDWWEFPGGKIEPGEAPEEALVREIREELDAAITVDRYLITVEYSYPAFHLSMDCFWCSLKDGHITLLEHEAAKWLPLNDLRQVDWLPADVIVVEAIEAERENSLAKNKEVIVEETTIMSTISLDEFTKNCGTKKSYVKKWLDGHLIPGVTLAPSLEDTLFPRSARRPYRFRAKIKPTTTAKDIRTHIVNACIRREHIMSDMCHMSKNEFALIIQDLVKNDLIRVRREDGITYYDSTQKCDSYNGRRFEDLRKFVINMIKTAAEGAVEGAIKGALK